MGISAHFIFSPQLEYVEEEATVESATTSNEEIEQYRQVHTDSSKSRDEYLSRISALAEEIFAKGLDLYLTLSGKKTILPLSYCRVSIRSRDWVAPC